jgi:hypothetical protein
MKMSLYQLYILKENMEQENLSSEKGYLKLCEKILNRERILEENTSATGGPAGSIGGMGAVVNAQPSGLAGATIGTSWASHGGTTGSGDVSVPYNPSGSNRVFQKIPTPSMGSNHGARTGKKSREKKLDLKALRSVFAKRQDFTAGQSKSGEKKVMSFDDFKKDDINKIKKETVDWMQAFGMNKSTCDRCGEPTNGVTTMSIFNEDVICMTCKQDEKNDPEYGAAAATENEEIQKGNANYKGAIPNYKPIKNTNNTQS